MWLLGSVGNPDLAVDGAESRDAGAHTRPAWHGGCRSQPCSSGTWSKAAGARKHTRCPALVVTAHGQLLIQVLHLNVTGRNPC